MTDTDRLFTHTASRALKTLQSKGRLAATIFLWKEDAVVTHVPLNVGSAFTKEYSMLRARQEAARLHATAAVMVTEVWMAGVEPGLENIRPSQRENRQEAVVVQVQLRGSDPEVRLYMIERDDQGRVTRLDPRPRAAGETIGGALVGLF